MNIFRETRPAVVEDEIRDAGIEMGVSFPDEMKTHYLRYNGGVPENPCWEQEDGITFCISEFLPIKYPSEGGTLESTYKRLIEKKIIPNTLIPFAVDWGGNYFCTDPDGYVYFYATDAWSDKLTLEENQRKATRMLCESLSQFIEQLIPDEDA